MSLDESLRARIQQTIGKAPIVLFMKGTKDAPRCGFSASVVELLDDLDVAFEDVDILADAALREALKVFSEWPTFPQLYVKGEFVGGADIVKEMHAKGELAPLLGADAKPPVEPKITITEPAVVAFRGAAGDADADEALRLDISPRFENDLQFGPRKPNDVVVTANGITLAMDAATARRADGLVIDFVQGAEGAGFRLENPNEPPRVRPMRPQDLKRLIESGDDFRLVDVRTEEEREKASIAGSRLYDHAYDVELAGLPKETKLVFQCHHGIRSAQAAQRFVERGFRNVWNLVGGIDAWSSIDPSVPRY